MIQILCVDDHQVVREGISLIISRSADMQVVATATTSDEAVSPYREHRPDITLMDLRLANGTSGVDAIRAIVAEDPNAIDIFLKNVDAAAVYANASTAFTDGAQFGLGAEIGISTQKLHARGPMALREMTSYKWLIRGDGTIRA